MSRMNPSKKEKQISDISVAISETKDVEILSTVLELRNGDEALKLVGAERSISFSEEYNARLRRKLV